MPAEQRYRSDTAASRPRQLAEDLPRTRRFAADSSSRPTAYVSVPVQLIVGTKDPVVRPHGFDDLSALGAAAVAARHQRPATGRRCRIRR